MENKPSISRLRRIKSTLEKKQKKYVTLDMLSRYVGLYSDVVADELVYFEPMVKMDTSMNMMDVLKQKDPIEFQLKMSQFKTQLQQQESSNPTNTTPTKDVIRCPKCNSTAITTGARGVNNFWGLLGASKTVNRCGNCGYTWKPKNW